MVAYYSMKIDLRSVALSHDGISSTCLVKKCMELEESCGVMIKTGILGGQRPWDRGQKKEL